MMNVYELYKAFKFRTLWEGDDPLRDFQRVASESAQGTGQLNGIVQLTNVLQKMEDVETAAVRCFTNNPYTTNIQKWSFDKDNNKQVTPSDTYTYVKVTEKLSKYKDLETEVTRMWEIRTETVPLLVIGAFGVIKKRLGAGTHRKDPGLY